MTEKKISNPIIDEGIDKSNGKGNRRHKGIKMKDIIYYSQKDLSCREIGKILNCSKQSISRRLIDWKRNRMKRERCATTN